MPFNSIHNLTKGLCSYLNEKNYNQAFGDVVPLVISNALKVQLDILNETSSTKATLVSIKPTYNENETILLHRSGQHYNGLVKDYTMHPPRNGSI